jgi:cytochrome c peroxidase
VTREHDRATPSTPARFAASTAPTRLGRRALRRERSAILVGIVIVVGALAAPACGDDAAVDDWQWDLPAGFPTPAVPADNPMTPAKVELGRYLFYDRRLSVNNSMSCATCHRASAAFADGRALPEGATGSTLARNSPGLQNVAYLSTYTWANPTLETLEQQVVVPMFGDQPIELGTGQDLAAVLARLAQDPVYPPLFAAAFPEEAEPISRAAIIRAVASFSRSMISGGSPFDRMQYGGDPGALSAAARRGMDLFFSERLECYHCHSGVNLTAAFRAKGSASVNRAFENDGLYNVANNGLYPPNNPGLYEFSGKATDHGKFRVPPLRNIALTAPYMHDGSIATLGEVIDMYARGGRLVTSGPWAGDGAINPNKSSLVRGFALSPQERDDLLEWLGSLSDPTFGEDPRFADPWTPP